MSLAELPGRGQPELEALFTLGGFPEPLFTGTERFARRWSRECRNRLVREELQDLERVDDLGGLDQLILALPDRVGSPLSINSLREDLRRTHKTVARWVDILERLYSIFRIAPFGAPRLRAVK
jgi:hypothetical protein